MQDVNLKRILVLIYISNRIKMGPYLTTPKKEKEVENGENNKVLSCRIRVCFLYII
jgi:hypothetical protein